jgi:hypothetical protein
MLSGVMKMWIWVVETRATWYLTISFLSTF